MLDFAEKYNWWTAEDKKKHISVDAKVEYVLEYGTVDDLKRALQEVGGEKLFFVWKDRILNKKYLKGRKKVIEYFVKHHKNFVV